MAIVHQRNGWEPDRRITCVRHPEANGIIESDKFGGIRTERGEAGWVLQNGEKVVL